MTKSICIAPGHGGFDPGASGNGLVEKNLTLAFGLALEQLLKDAKVPVVMTRTGDYAAGHATTIMGDLEIECAIANNARSDLFVCIHCNSAPQPNTGTGSEVYVYRMGGESADIATKVVDSVGTLMGLRSPAVKQGSDLYVLRNTKMPAFLIEVGFIDDTHDAELMNTHVQEIAQLMATPLIAWAGGSVPQPLPDVAHLPTDVAASIAEVEKLGLMTRDANGDFLPDATVARWELAVVVDRLLTHLKG